MFGYFLKRILLIIPTVMVVTLIIFILMASLPGTNTFRMVTYADGAGAGKSLLEQYFIYIWRIITRLDFGRDSVTRLNLSGEILKRFVFTLKFTGISLVITLVVGIPCGIWSAIHRGAWQDRLTGTLTMVISAIPAFCIAFALVIIFAVKLGWFHVLHISNRDYIPPLVTLALTGIATVTRITRTAMSEVLDTHYITALRSLGISRGSIIYKHALKNALVPIVSVLGSITGQLICGSIVVERFFSLQGIGMYMITSIGTRSTSVVLGSVVLISTAMCLISVISDAIYLIVNPSMREAVSWRSGGSLRRKGESAK